MRRSLLLLCISACGFDPKAGGVLCGAAGECPSGLECCDDGLCRDDCGGGDGGPCIDKDVDLVCDADDNCPGVFNPGQYDCDGNEMGDACDPVLEAYCLTLRGGVVSVGGASTSSSYTLRGAGGLVPAGSGQSTEYRLRGGVTTTTP